MKDKNFRKMYVETLKINKILEKARYSNLLISIPAMQILVRCFARKKAFKSLIFNSEFFRENLILSKATSIFSSSTSEKNINDDISRLSQDNPEKEELRIYKLIVEIKLIASLFRGNISEVHKQVLLNFGIFDKFKKIASDAFCTIEILKNILYCLKIALTNLKTEQISELVEIEGLEPIFKSLKSNNFDLISQALDLVDFLLRNIDQKGIFLRKYFENKGLEDEYLSKLSDSENDQVRSQANNIIYLLNCYKIGRASCRERV